VICWTWKGAFFPQRPGHSGSWYQWGSVLLGFNREKSNCRSLLHVVPDDKFIDMAIREFEAVAPGMNRWVILGKNRPLHYIKSDRVGFLSINKAKSLVREKKYGAVVIHGLDSALPLLEDISEDKKVVWLGWGYDYYGRLLSPAFPDGLYLRTTKSLIATAPKRPFIRRLVSAGKSAIKKAIGRQVTYSPRLLGRVDIFSPVLDIEYQMACDMNPWFKPEYTTWNYGSAEEDFCTAGVDGQPLGGNILVGNSATPENNHLELFEILRRHIDLTGRNIIVPLNYGDPWYKEKIISIGHGMFGAQFVPLTDYMDKDAYIHLLHSCGHVFMNHLRQQALGNICIMMLKGAKVYMNSASPLYRWLENKGAIIQSLSDFSEKPECSILRPLSESQKAVNVKVINGHWGRDIQRQRTRKLIELALSMRLADR
jgi:dTDP-N-acetylfucosamine:lipid II N-acetylfucosaminyltransferase